MEPGKVVREDPSRMAGYPKDVGAVVWLTGLSGAGKSTIAQALRDVLLQQGVHCCVLDGDLLRQGLCSDLGFSASDRTENIRRHAEVARLFARAGVLPIVAAISPYADDRGLARAAFPAGGFLEVHVDTPLAVCEQRDPKGLYRRARSGELRQFTGIDAPYEAPVSPALRLNTAEVPVHDCVSLIIEAFSAKGGFRG